MCHQPNGDPSSAIPGTLHLHPIQLPSRGTELPQSCGVAVLQPSISTTMGTTAVWCRHMECGMPQLSVLCATYIPVTSPCTVEIPIPTGILTLFHIMG